MSATIPTELNGHPVIRFDRHDNGYATIMVKRGADDFVVATWWPALGKAWSWGHYFIGGNAIVDAIADFVETAHRNENRGR